MALFNEDLEYLKNTIEVLRKKLYRLVIEEQKSISSLEVIQLSQKLDEYLLQLTKRK